MAHKRAERHTCACITGNTSFILEKIKCVETHLRPWLPSSSARRVGVKINITSIFTSEKKKNHTRLVGIVIIPRHGYYENIIQFYRYKYGTRGGWNSFITFASHRWKAERLKLRAQWERSEIAEESEIERQRGRGKWGKRAGERGRERKWGSDFSPLIYRANFYFPQEILKPVVLTI